MTFDEFSKMVQWLTDNIGSVLLVISNILAILAAIKTWWEKQKLAKMTKAMVEGVEDYSRKDTATPNCEVKKAIQDRAIAYGIDIDLKSLIKRTFKK